VSRRELLVVVAAACATTPVSSSATGVAGTNPSLVWSTSALVEESPGHSVQRLMLWFAELDGARLRRPRFLAEGGQPALSPDGRWVAFSRRSSTYVVSSTGGRAGSWHGTPCLRVGHAPRGSWPPSIRATGYSSPMSGRTCE
jgi:hypothetical protein